MTAREVKLCLLGESGVGKSSIVQRFIYDTFRPVMDQTIGAAFCTKTITLGSASFTHQIWDTAGQEKYRALAPMYYRGSAAAIVVYDITRKASFSTVKTWISELQRHADTNIVIAIAGNKCDMEAEREVESSEAATYATSQGAIFVETSAKTAVNIHQLFVEITKRLAVQEEWLCVTAPPDDVHKLSTTKLSTKRPSCCHR